MNLSTELFYILYYLIIPCVAQSILELYVYGRLINFRPKCRTFTSYIVLSLFLSAAETYLQFAASPIYLAVRILLLSLLGKYLFKPPLELSLMAAIIVETVLFLSNGILAPITFLLVSFSNSSFNAFIGFAAPVISFILFSMSSYVMISRFRLKAPLPSKYFTVFFIPVLSLLLIEQYIINQVYGNHIVIEGTQIIKPLVDHWSILLIQMICFLTLFSILYACKKLTEDFDQQFRISLLESQLSAQKIYVKEAQLRYEKTRSFRHDIKNHFTLLNRLLKQSEVQKAMEYLDKMNKISESLSFLCSTGNAVVDLLLSSKLSAAQQIGIQVECTLKLPPKCLIDDFDFCVLLSNATDNAIHACELLEQSKSKFISISGKERGDFLMLEIENSCELLSEVKKGTGLSNIEAIAEKYNGVITIDSANDCFRLNVLLIHSRNINDISANKL